MPINDYSPVPSANTSINGINIAEGCPPSGVNNAIRQMMADIVTGLSLNTRLFDVRAYGAISDAVVTTGGTVTTGTDCNVAVTNAIAAAVAAGVSETNPMGILFQGGAFYTTKPVPLVSGLSFVGIDGVLYGNPPTPVSASKGHYATAVVSMVGTTPDADWAAFPGTGDYAVDPVRAFAASTVILPGATSIPAAAAPTGVTAGSWIHLSQGWAFWHGVTSEMVQVDSVVGNTINLKTPTRYGYDNLPTGLAKTIQTFTRTQNPVSGVNFASWEPAGFRRVVPCRNSRIFCRNFAIRNISNPSGGGYQAFSVFGWMASNCRIEGLRSEGGAVWMLDCQDIDTLNLTINANYASSSVPTAGVFLNGSNSVNMAGATRLQTARFDMEEGVNDVNVDNLVVNNGFVKFAAASKNITVRTLTVVGNSASLQMGSGDVAPGPIGININGGSVTGGGSAFAYYHAPLMTALPTLPAANVAAIAPYFSGKSNMVRNALLLSPLGPSAEIFMQFDRSRMEDCRIGTTANAGSASPQPIIGTAYRALDGELCAVRTAAALPTVPAAFTGEIVRNSTGGAGWTATRINNATVNSNPTTTTLVVNGYVAATDYAVGDVVQVLCSNGTFSLPTTGTLTALSATITAVPSTAGVVVGMPITGPGIPNGTTVASFGANSITMSAAATFGGTLSPIVVASKLIEHVAVITVVNLGTTTITIGAAIPAGFTAVTTTGGYIRTTRWT